VDPSLPPAASAPLSGATLSWDITSACNLACTHCSNADDRDNAGPDLKIESAAHMLAEFVEAGGTALHVLGGEPFLRKDILTEIALARQLGLSVSLTTNGTVIPGDDAVDWLLQQLTTLTISLDGSNAAINDCIRGLDTFSRATRALTKYRARRDHAGAPAKLNVSHVLCRGNVSSIVAMIDCVTECGGDEVSITYLKPYGNALRLDAPMPATALGLRDAFLAAGVRAETAGIAVTLFEVPMRVQTWLRQQSLTRVRFAGDTYCDTAEGQLRASSDGKVFPCFAGTKHHAQHAATTDDVNIERVSLRTMLEGSFYADFKRSAHSALASTPWTICQGCEHFHSKTCYPGCPFEPKNLKPQLCALLEAGR
jgi:MoaA/NifB/PqqE/SkfB family radical SAM enzyme